MFKQTLMSLMLTAAFGAPAFAHDARQPSLLSALVNVGNHGSIATVNANAGATTQPSYRAPATASVADVKANVLGVVKADVDVGQTTRNNSGLLNLNLSVLGGGVGNSRDRY